MLYRRVSSHSILSVWGSSDVMMHVSGHLMLVMERASFDVDTALAFAGVSCFKRKVETFGEGLVGQRL